jgi:hypothetical protein
MAIIPAHVEANTQNAPKALLARNPIDDDMKKKIDTVVPLLRARNLMSEEGAAYLKQWSSRTLHVHPRPEYRWLQHRWKRVAGLPEAKLSSLCGVDVMLGMKKIRCNWKIRGSELNESMRPRCVTK